MDGTEALSPSPSLSLLAPARCPQPCACCCPPATFDASAVSDASRAPRTASEWSAWLCSLEVALCGCSPAPGPLGDFGCSGGATGANVFVEAFVAETVLALGQPRAAGDAGLAVVENCQESASADGSPRIAVYIGGYRVYFGLATDGDMHEAERMVASNATFDPAPCWGAAWFQFAFALSRHDYELLVIVRRDLVSNDLDTCREVAPSASAGARVFRDRWCATMATASMCQVLLALKYSLPEITYPYLKKCLHNDTELVFHRSYVSKSFLSSSDHWAQLVTLYNVLRGHTCENLVAVSDWRRIDCPATKDGSLRYHISVAPVGERVLPSSEPELKGVMRQVLNALRCIHAVGYAHCDVRWPNVLKYEGRWVLIDLEEARPFGASIGHLIAPPAEKVSSVQSDLFMVGSMVRFSKVENLSAQAKRFIAWLCSQDAGSRPRSIDEVLDHEWVKAPVQNTRTQHE
eukprot:m51a1_g13707 hypothetical protein (462) ;mRNA; r:80035-81957